MKKRGAMFTLAELKAHLRIDHDDEDAHLSLLLGMATAAAEDFCLRTFAEDFSGQPPDAVRLAVLLYAGHFYTNRENNDPVAYQAMTQAFQALLWPYRDLTKLI
jgi:uncharacterized phage protein (predicted DNA packaging)